MGSLLNSLPPKEKQQQGLAHFPMSCWRKKSFRPWHECELQTHWSTKSLLYTEACVLRRPFVGLFFFLETPTFRPYSCLKAHLVGGGKGQWKAMCVLLSVGVRSKGRALLWSRTSVLRGSDSCELRASASFRSLPLLMSSSARKA